MDPKWIALLITEDIRENNGINQDMYKLNDDVQGEIKTFTAVIYNFFKEIKRKLMEVKYLNSSDYKTRQILAIQQPDKKLGDIHVNNKVCELWLKYRNPYEEQEQFATFVEPNQIVFWYPGLNFGAILASRKELSSIILHELIHFLELEESERSLISGSIQDDLINKIINLKPNSGMIPIKIGNRLYEINFSFVTKTSVGTIDFSFVDDSELSDGSWQSWAKSPEEVVAKISSTLTNKELVKQLKNMLNEIADNGLLRKRGEIKALAAEIYNTIGNDKQLLIQWAASTGDIIQLRKLLSSMTMKNHIDLISNYINTKDDLTYFKSLFYGRGRV